MAKKQIYTVFTCDDWKSTNSMKLIMCTTSKRKLKSFIASKIKDDTFGYDDEERSKTKQIEQFKFDFNTGLRDIINERLHNGYFDYCYDGEEV